MSSEPTRGLDIREQSRSAQGVVHALDRRLFMQLLGFGDCSDTRPLLSALQSADLPCVLYEDVNDPRGVALLTFSENPDFFLCDLRAFLQREPFRSLTPRPELTMLGRTYAQGDEQDLEHALLRRPRERACSALMPWAIWYPLRRRGSFEQLPAAEQRVILMEHGGVGAAFGRAGYATDIRLAAHGLMKHDDDFVIGLVGPDLYPLSSIVQRMRKTKQTSQYLERLGPFFTGRAVLQQDRPAQERARP